MRVKIQKSMLLVITITLVVTFTLLSTLFYMKSLNEMKAEVRQEALYIWTAIEISGTSYLDEMDKVQIRTRLTQVDTEGKVLYDSKEQEYSLENHAGREEIDAAFRTGKGEALRTSKTIGKITYYYAMRLSDGTVLRASKTIDNLFPTMIRVLPYLLIVGGVMIVLAYFLAKWQTARLIAPINELDLSNPMGNDIYEEFKPLMKRIESRNQAREEIANMRKEFSANVSHELKTPLTSISGYAEIMKSGLVKEEDMISFSERIHSEASRMITLIGDIIKLSKLDEGNLEGEKEWVNLYELSKEICDRLSLTAQKRDVHMHISGEYVSYFGVRQILDEMIYNLCENAIKYNVEGGRVSLWVGDTPQGIKVIVEDTGIGIPDDQVERIFERFYRVDKSHSRETGGTGLGLSIVKHGAIFHHAQILVDSKVGKGTRMEIVFEQGNCYC